MREQLHSYFVRFNADVHLPISITILIIAGLSILVYLLTNQKAIKSPWPTWILTSLLLGALICYFGFLPLITVGATALLSCVLGKAITRKDDALLSLIVGFFLIIEAYIILAFFLDITMAMIVLYVLTAVFLATRRSDTTAIVKDIPRTVTEISRRLNPLDYFVVLLALVIGSAPQYHWDAVHANLYNAKWYVERNSFRVIPESIASLFPQNGIGFYSFFYKIGGLRTLQIGYVLPLLITLGITKRITWLQQWPAWLVGLMYSALLLPVVIFESSTGYYDFLAAALMLSVFYLVLTTETRKVMVVYLSLFLIGFAAAIKYFPMAIAPIPLILWLKQIREDIRGYALRILIGIIVVFLPLSIWSLRAYQTTGSPVFPFFQQFFPTPELWNPDSHLEEHPILKTPTTVHRWLTGGFIMYPVLTYVYTDKYLEAYQGYTGIAAIALMGIVVLVIIIGLLKVLRRIPFTRTDYLFWASLAAYFVVGIVTRYYRYLWPFQLLLTVAALTSLNQYVNRRGKSSWRKFLLVTTTILLVFSSVIEIARYYRHYPHIFSSLFQPEKSQEATYHGPLTYLESHLSVVDKPVLDGSLYSLPRLFVPSRVYQCNWYWIEGTQRVRREMKDQEIIDLLHEFSYVVYTSSGADVPNLCNSIIKRSRQLDILDQVYADELYTIYRVVTP